MADMLAIAAAAAWLLAFGWCAAATGRPALRAGTADPGQTPPETPAQEMPAPEKPVPEKPVLEKPALEKPALVNLAVTRCRLNGAAYPATILDLAAGGYLAITERGPGRLWCEVPAFPPAQADLARSERLVLAGAGALAGVGGAPFEALAESCASDVHGRWHPFERAVRAEGRRAGITRPRLSAATRSLLYAGAVAVAALAFAAIHGGSHSGLWAPAATAFVAFAVPAYWAHSLSRQDRLTSHGSALGAWASRAAADMTAAEGAPGLAPPFSPTELTRVTWAVAAGVPVQVPGATPGLMTGVRPCRRRAGARTGIPGQFAGTARPAAAWSSFGGKWRMVRIGPPPSRRMHPALWLVLAAWLALMAYVSSLLPGLAGVLLPAALAAGSAATVLAGARGLAAWLARPAGTSFQAQVIARWVEHRGANDDDASITCVAVDDGERSWSFDVSGAAFGQLALGDTVAVRASPRSGKLLGLIPGQNGLSGRTTAPGGTGLGARDETTLRRAAATRPPGVAAAEAPPGVAAAEGPPGVAAERPPGEAVGESPPGEAVGERPPGEAAAAEAWPGMAAGGRTGAAPRGTLLAADEVSAAVGRPVRVTPLTARRASAVYRGEGVTVIVTVAEGFLGGLTSLARRRGCPLPGAGDEAWLLNRGRTVVMRVGGMTAKLTLGGSAARSLPPQVLAQLAATVGERLAHHVASPGTPTSTSCRD
jgi:hypothetical protein